MKCSKCGKNEKRLIFVHPDFFSSTDKTKSNTFQLYNDVWLVNQRDNSYTIEIDADFDVLPFCIDCLPINALKLGQLGVKIDPYKEEKE